MVPPVPTPRPTPEPTTTSTSTRTTTPGATPRCEFTIRLYTGNGGGGFNPITSYKLQYQKCTHLPGAKPGEPAYEVSEASFFPGQPEDYCLTYHMTVRACDDTSSSFTVFTDGMRSTCKNLLDGGEGYMCNGESARMVAPVPTPRPTPEPTTTSTSTRTTTPGATPRCEFTIRLYTGNGGGGFNPITSYKLQYQKCTHLPGAKPGEPAYEVSEASFLPGQ